MEEEAGPVQTPALQDQILKQHTEKFNFYSVLGLKVTPTGSLSLPTHVASGERFLKTNLLSSLVSYPQQNKLKDI